VKDEAAPPQQAATVWEPVGSPDGAQNEEGDAEPAGDTPPEVTPEEAGGRD
jgi:hypothetical protein